MNIANDYKSVVIIGGFNPTILTPSFLRDCCGYSTDCEPVGQTTPVLSELRFGSSRFLMELNRFQISILEPSSFDGLFPLDLAMRYLDVLQYTPLSLIGLNLNFSLSEVKLASLREVLKDPWSIGQVFGIKPISVSLSVQKPNDAGLQVHEVVISHLVNPDIKNSLRLTFGSQDVTINNNYEVGNLGQERKRMSVLIDRHNDLLSMNQSLINDLGAICR